MSNGTNSRWKPTETVSDKVFIGRRAFGNRVFANDKAVLRYRIDVFLDPRKSDLSVDRLGIRQISDDIVAFLHPLCESMAAKGGTKFRGWARLKVGDLRACVRKTKATNEENPYHAEIDRSEFVSQGAQRAFAFELCTQASKYEFVHKPMG